MLTKKKHKSISSLGESNYNKENELIKNKNECTSKSKS